MVFRPSRLVLPLLLPTLLLCESCRSQRQFLADSTVRASSRAELRSELESSRLRSLSSFLSVDVIDSLFLLASPVQCDSPALAQYTPPLEVFHSLIPVAARHMVVRAAAVENDTAHSVLKTDGTTATTTNEHGSYHYYDPPPRSHDFAVLLLLSVALVSCIILYKTRER